MHAIGLLNTPLERQKGRNMAANPKVSPFVVDPGNIHARRINLDAIHISDRCPSALAVAVTKVHLEDRELQR